MDINQFSLHQYNTNGRELATKTKGTKHQKNRITTNIKYGRIQQRQSSPTKLPISREQSSESCGDDQPTAHRSGIEMEAISKNQIIPHKNVGCGQEEWKILLLKYHKSQIDQRHASSTRRHSDPLLKKTVCKKELPHDSGLNLTLEEVSANKQRNDRCKTSDYSETDSFLNHRQSTDEQLSECEEIEHIASRGLSCGWLQTLPTLCNSSKGDGEKSWFRSFLGKSGAASKKLSRRKKLAAFKTSLRQNRLETALQAALKQEKWDTLRSELIHQSQQMRKWGLFSVEGPYRLQARLRLARLKLELDVERLKIQVLKMREEETACLIKANDSFAAGDDVDEAFFASKDELFEGNISIRELNIRRVYFDECCIKAIGKFRQSVVASGLCLSKDPERQLTRLQRKAVAIDLLGQYALLMLQDRVQTANSSMSTLMSSFRTLRLKQRRIQIKFSEQVEDERTREGRLFQRWVEMVKLKTTEKTHPEEVMAFVNYYVQCLKQSWGMRVDTPLEYAFEKAGLPSADAALLQLVQDIVFRRLWHLVFGYNKETNDVKDLIWRQKVLGVRKLPFKQLGVPKEYFPEGFIEEDAEEQTAGVRQQESAEPIEAPSSFPFQCSSWMLSQMGICLTPKSMITCMFQGIELLQTEAQKYSKESSLLGADALFPIFAFSILHADLPYIHQCLQFLKNFSGSDAMGEEVYYMTMMEAAVAFIMKFDVAIELGPKSRINEDNLLDSMPLRSESSGSPLLCKRSNDANAMDGENISATKAMENLGDWIGQHQAMEETIDVLEQEGWMA